MLRRPRRTSQQETSLHQNRNALTAKLIIGETRSPIASMILEATMNVTVRTMERYVFQRRRESREMLASFYSVILECIKSIPDA